MAITHPSPKTQVDYSQQINDGLNDFFIAQISQAKKVSPYYVHLWQEMHRLVLAGGKRLRPKMTVLAYEAFGGKETAAIIPVAIAQELLHACLLMHDDIIDKDYIRYGVHNVAGAYVESYASFVADKKDREHYASGAAILAGDLLLSSAYRMIAESQLPPALLLSTQVLLSDGVFSVAGGELIDTESSFRPAGSVPAETVALYKTSSYTFVAPLLIGATLAGATDEQKMYLRVFAENLGIAFQLRDDVLGVFGDENKTGKTTVGDIREGKRTFMIEQFYANSATALQQEFEHYFGNFAVTLQDMEKVKEILVTSGALDCTEDAIALYVERALNAVAKLHLSAEQLKQFVELTTACSERVR